MGKSCETCKQWEEHHYWDILDDQGKSFFKVIMDDSHEMTIPQKFAQRFKGNISRTVKLEARNGSICDVVVKTCADKIILQDGWKEFFNKHQLEKGDFLVFRYNGDYQFKVEIFDPTGCEKVSSCVSMNNTHPTATVKTSHEYHSRRSLDNTMERSSSATPSEESGDVSSSQDDFTVNYVPYMMRHKAHLTQLQEDKVEEIAQAINSNIPILVTIMRQSHVNRRHSRFEFLKEYADTYLPQEKQRVVLQRNGKRWTMLLNDAASRARKLIHGWGGFVKGNDLRIGDICLFDLLDNKKICTMNVHVIRAKKGDRQ